MRVICSGLFFLAPFYINLRVHLEQCFSEFCSWTPFLLRKIAMDSHILAYVNI